ncbi:hypothetical protein HK101_011463 [Irineochytrium annulatum]|nr:hypothetical protein HK101_011463 [Irineochytrium annulatum]
MLKASTPVAVLFANAVLTTSPIELKTFLNVSVIVFGVMIASYGEIEFVVIGVIVQIIGIGCEAIRLVMVQVLLNSKNYNMDPLCSLYFFAPVCAVMNGVACLIFEREAFSLEALSVVGFPVFLLNAVVAFGLNVAVVFLIGKTSSLVLCLSGVLKDIILVALSILIWQTTVTPLQFFGYALALGGLVVYKSGGLPKTETVNEVVASYLGASNLRAKKAFLSAGAVAALISTVIYLTPNPANYLTPERTSDANLALAGSNSQVQHGAGAVLVGGSGSQLLNSGNSDVDQALRFSSEYRDGLDVVIPQENSDLEATAAFIRELRSIPALAAEKAHFVVINYGSSDSDEGSSSSMTDEKVLSQTGCDRVVRLQGNKGGRNGAYLQYLYHQQSEVARNNVFLHVGGDHGLDGIKQVPRPSKENVSAAVEGDMRRCGCDGCDESHDHPRIAQIYAIVERELCPNFGFASAGMEQFIVNGKRIRKLPRQVYKNLYDVIASDKSSSNSKEFVEAMSQSWSIVFGCSDVTFVEACSKWGRCQCSDV